jgi:hypothetical protein
MRLRTDTATLAVFDPVRLRHRLAAPADWWTITEWLLTDMNAGNVLAFDLGSDGVYDITIHLDADRPEAHSTKAPGGLIACDSQCLYIGPGEQITGAGLEPDDSLDGLRLPISAGVYRVRVAVADPDTLDVWIEPSTEPAQNHFLDYVRL